MVLNKLNLDNSHQLKEEHLYCRRIKKKLGHQIKTNFEKNEGCFSNTYAHSAWHLMIHSG